LSGDKFLGGKLSGGKLSAGELLAGELSAGELLAGELSAGKLSADKLPLCPQDFVMFAEVAKWTRRLCVNVFEVFLLLCIEFECTYVA
jgi:hypothetical protein